MENSKNQRKILPTITTTKNSNWQKKIKEINDLELEEIAVFPTCLDAASRQKLYELLEDSTVKRIPFVHLRSDMTVEELDYFFEKYSTNIFNVHSRSEYPIPSHYLKYKNNIFIENIFNPLKEEELKNFGGVCLDFSHLKNDELTEKEKFKHNTKVLEKYPIGCNHISPVWKNWHLEKNVVTHQDVVRYDNHFMKNFSELEYLKNYPLEYFSSVIAIEMENSIKEQLKVKEYIEKIIS